MTRAACIALATGLALAATSAWAKAPEDQVARLGKDLTPIGAERAGNADGTIPEWTGGITAPPPGWKPGDPRVSPFKDDAKLFSIDASNVDQYADKLAPGQIELIKRYQGYRLDVYPTRRGCAQSEWSYERTLKNASTARLDEDDIYLVDGWGGVLFPIPNSGAEVIWNHTTAFFGAGKIEYNAIIVPTKSGSIVPVKEKAIYNNIIHQPDFSSLEEAKGKMCTFLLETMSPPRVAGELILVHEMANEPRRAWIYNPGQRRVRRAPTVAYDNPIAGAESLLTNDQGRMFNGMLDRFDWKLLGKKEMYILYNNFRINNDRSLKYSEFMGAQYPRRDIFRYELHRVWVVEATVKAGKRHLFSKRVFYLDEDSWGANHEDIYDRRGGLWRVMEGGPKLIAEVPACIQDGTFSYDLAAGRYVADRIKTEEPEADWLAGQEGRIDPNIFKPDSLRRMGRR